MEIKPDSRRRPDLFLADGKVCTIHGHGYDPQRYEQAAREADNPQLYHERQLRQLPRKKQFRMTIYG